MAVTDSKMAGPIMGSIKNSSKPIPISRKTPTVAIDPKTIKLENVERSFQIKMAFLIS